MASNHRPRYRILVVNSSAEDRLRHRRLLEASPDFTVEVDEAESGAAALEALKRIRPDGVVVDQSLPDMDGLEFLERLGQAAGRDDEPAAPVILLTGQDDRKTANDAHQRGAHECLIKRGLTGDALCRAVQRAAHHASMQRLVHEHRRELERSRRELEHFARILAHDLRSPLATIIWLLSSVQEAAESRLDEESKEDIDDAISAAGRIDRMISDLLDYCRASHRDRLDEAVECDDVMEMVIENLQTEIESSGARVEVERPLPAVIGDKSQLVLLFQNLVANGIKYCKDRTPVVRVDAQPAPDGWVFRVRDNGMGIERDHAERIFQAFVRLHSHHDFPGSGLGLATCKKVVANHDGAIWFESEPGQGSTFYVKIPLPDDALTHEVSAAGSA